MTVNGRKGIPEEPHGTLDRRRAQCSRDGELHRVAGAASGTVQGHRLQDSPRTWVTVVGTYGGADALEGDLTHGPEATLRRRLLPAVRVVQRAVRTLRCQPKDWV